MVPMPFPFQAALLVVAQLKHLSADNTALHASAVKPGLKGRQVSAAAQLGTMLADATVDVLTLPHPKTLIPKIKGVHS